MRIILINNKSIMEYTKEEKHTPVIWINWNTVRVIVPNHPAQSEEHYISNISLFEWKWWELIASKELTHNDEAVLEVEVKSTDNLYATEVCNLHWEWDSEWKILWM